MTRLILAAVLVLAASYAEALPPPNADPAWRPGS